VDVVQIDEFPIGSIYPCYNESHGHTLGYSREIPEAYRSILAEARTLGRMINPDFILSMEEPCEFYLPYMDTYVSRDNAPEFLIYPIAVELYGNDMEYIPFFSQVYHEYITAFSEPIPMNYDYPEPFTDQMRRSIARAFVTGEIISGSADLKENLRPLVRDLYNKTVRASASYCNDYLIKGKPLRPPEIDVPDQTVQWYFYSNETAGRPFEDRSVLHSTWESDDGDIGHVFVNWVDKNVEFDVNIESYDLKDGNYSLIITRNGERQILTGRTSLPVNVNLETAPGDVILIEVTRIPDFVLGDIDVNTNRILTNETIVVSSLLENLGTRDSDAFSVGIFIDRKEIYSVDYPVLEEGKKQDVSFIWDTTGLLGEYNISIECEPGSFDLDPFNNERWKIVEVLERPRSNLKVVVNDSKTGLPLENVTVELERTDPTEFFTMDTNINGEVLFRNIISGSFSLKFSRFHYRNGSMEVVISEGKNKTIFYDLIWKEYSYLNGTIIDNSTGFIVEGASVSLYFIGTSGKEMVSSINSTSIEGFNFTELEEGKEFLLEVELEGYLPYSRSFHPNQPLGNIEVRLDKLPPLPGRISGRVIDNETGIPIPSVEIRMESPVLSVISDEYGGFNFSDLIPGNYTLIISIQGYENYSIEIIVVDNDTTQVDIRLARIKQNEPEPEPESFHIKGRVIDQEGDSIGNAEIIVLELQLSLKTNATGHFVFSNITKGNYTLIISKEGYEELEIIVSSGTSMKDIILIEEDVGEDPSLDFNLVIIVVIVILTVLGAVLVYTRSRGSSMEEE
jgi:5-hydroxyisourate hydrolase-like protein (transthyretin family)